MGSRVISLQRLVNIHQLDVIFLKINNILWASNKQSRYWNWFFDSWRLHLRRHILAAWCDEYVMIHYNRNNNAYCRAVNAEMFQTVEHNPVWISILWYARNPYSYSHFEIVISIYSVNINQISTNTSNYTICSAPNVYILIETRIAPLMALAIPKCSDDLHLQTNQQKVNTNPKAYLVNMQVSFRYPHLLDLYRTCRTVCPHRLSTVPVPSY